ncbi:hypothetical protein CJF32_00002870 [Rutstroemia sp. NJR-2017a WRK4]|nr:hypothetical protein CJF32_00002870 [Rutstroemia sp. NJR-2017a WRK4]
MLPTSAALIWLTLLTSLLICWAEFPPRDPRDPAILADPPYPSMFRDSQRVPYISDVAASPEIKPYFIVGCIMTTFVLDASLIADRWLRHRGRLAKNTDGVEKVLACCGIGGAIIGTMGLVFLGIFDVQNYRVVHHTMLGFFIAGYSFTALFTCLEYYRMSRKYRAIQPSLLLSSQIKLIFMFIEAMLGVAFWFVLLSGNWDACAAIEWTVSYVFSLYILSYLFDFLPALNTKSKDCRFGSYVEGDVEVCGHGRRLQTAQIRGINLGSEISTGVTRGL